MSNERWATVVGRFPKPILKSCIQAAIEAGIFPASIFRTGRSSAVIIGDDVTKPVFVRWGGMAPNSIEWTLEARLFSARWDKTMTHAIADLLSDPATKKRKVKV